VTEPEPEAAKPERVLSMPPAVERLLREVELVQAGDG
jgi:hypothetical protein